MTPDRIALRVHDAAMSADLGHSKLPPEVLALHGMSAAKNRHFLSSLCAFDGCHFLEVGSYCGASVISASYDNPGRFTAIDNFETHPHASRGPNGLRANLDKFANHCDVDFREGDCWEIARHLAPDSVNVFCYDGDHSEAAHAYALVAFRPVLESVCLYIVDDWRWECVKYGTAAGLTLGNWAELKRWELDDPSIPHGRKHGWWNGVVVFLLEKRG